MDLDIGKAQREAYNEGYIEGLTDLANKIENELYKSSWYSKGRILGLVERFKGKYQKELE